MPQRNTRGREISERFAAAHQAAMAATDQAHAPWGMGPQRGSGQRDLAKMRTLVEEDYQTGLLRQQQALPGKVEAAAQMAENMGGAQPVGPGQTMGQGYNLGRMLQDPNVAPETAAMSLAGRPGANPLQDAERARLGVMQKQAGQDRAAALQEQQLVRAQTGRQQFTDLKSAGRAVSRVDDLMTMMGEEGKLLLPDAAKGRYTSMRTRMLLDIKNIAQLGQISESDMDMMNALVVDATSLNSGTQGQRMAAMQTLREMYMEKVDDLVSLYGSPYPSDAFIGPKRSFQDLMEPLDAGMTEVSVDDLPENTPQSPSGDLMPFGAVMQQLGF